MRPSISLAALALALTAFAAEARTPSLQPLPMRQAGTLTCTMDPALGLVFGSTRGALCQYVSNFGGFTQTYTGRFDRVGFDVGLTSAQVITWRVFTPGGRSTSHMLNGVFAGPSAEATVFAGPGTQVLFDDRGERVALEPLAQSGQAGLNLAFGSAGFGLASSGLAVVR